MSRESCGAQNLTNGTSLAPRITTKKAKNYIRDIDKKDKDTTIRE